MGRISRVLTDYYRDGEKPFVTLERQNVEDLGAITDVAQTVVGNDSDVQVNNRLQKIEEYDGISFLATNNLNNFDAAFRRRITFIVPMHLPDAEIRKRLWEKVFPQELPKEAIDYTIIAENGEMSGSSIKSAALQAAYRAAWEKRPVSRMDIVDAIDGEYKKNGALSIRQELIRGKM